MVRISDARMSGTAFGTIVLHVTPEAATGGPLAAGAQRRPHHAVGGKERLELLVDAAEIARRLADAPARPVDSPARGYLKLFLQSVTQADRGCDFDFLARTPQHD